MLQLDSWNAIEKKNWELMSSLNRFQKFKKDLPSARERTAGSSLGMKLCQILYNLHYYLLLGRGFFGFFIWCKLFLVGHDVFFLIFMNNSLSVNPAKEITKAKHSMKICWMHSLDHHQKYHNTAVTHKVGGGGLYARGGSSRTKSLFQLLSSSKRKYMRNV